MLPYHPCIPFQSPTTLVNMPLHNISHVNSHAMYEIASASTTSLLYTTSIVYYSKMSSELPHHHGLPHHLWLPHHWATTSSTKQHDQRCGINGWNGKNVDRAHKDDMVKKLTWHSQWSDGDANMVDRDDVAHLLMLLCRWCGCIDDAIRSDDVVCPNDVAGLLML